MTSSTPRTATLLALAIASASCGSSSTGPSASTSTPQACRSPSGAPAAVAPAPTPAQLSYQRTELTAFIHFGLATFDGTEQGDVSVDTPSLFNPTNLDATSVANWVSALKGAGIGQVMLVAKHSTGFGLWPTQTTDFSVKSSPVRVFLAHVRVGDHGDFAVAGSGDQGDDSAALEKAENAFADSLHKLLDVLLAGCRRGVEHPAFAVPVGAVDTIEEERVKVR